MSSKHIRFIWFGDIDAPKPYKFTGSGGFYFATAGAGRFLSTETQPQEHRLLNRPGRVGKPAGNRRKTTKNPETRRN